MQVFEPATLNPTHVVSYCLFLQFCIYFITGHTPRHNTEFEMVNNDYNLSFALRFKTFEDRDTYYLVPGPENRIITKRMNTPEYAFLLGDY